MRKQLCREIGPDKAFTKSAPDALVSMVWSEWISIKHIVQDAPCSSFESQWCGKSHADRVCKMPSWASESQLLYDLYDFPLCLNIELNTVRISFSSQS